MRLFVLSALLVPAFACAQTYPTRPVRLVVASSPGSGVDIVARIVAQRMSETLGAQMIVDNRPGAGATLGVLNVVKSAPDGYTLLMAAPSLTISASYVRDLAYDPLRDLAPVGQATTGHYVLVVHPSLPVRSVKDLIALARARPGQLNFGSGGNGNSTHLAMEYFRSLTGIDLVHIPYKGSGAAVTDMISGQIHLMFANITAAVPHVKTGKMRALAASGHARSLALPQLPTVVEAGVPGYVVSSWFGLAAPARTPPDVISRLNAVLTTAMNGRDMRERLAGEGAEPAPGSAADFGRHLASEVAIWAKVVKSSGVQ
jgi:tripartite-type tricarboxylate transporter receptor subunit TctC